MNPSRIFFIVWATILGGAHGYAQISLPPMDIQIKGGYALIDMTDQNNNYYYYGSPIVSTELNWNFSQHFSCGAFITKAIHANVEFQAEISKANKSYGSGYQSYGLKLRYTADRSHRFRPFAELSYGKLNMYIEKDTYRISSEGNTLGFSFGLMIRLRSNLYLIIPQYSQNIRSDHFFFEKDGSFAFGKYPSLFELKAGLAYNFGKKK